MMSESLKEALNIFEGMEPHEIATALKKQGIRGRPHTLYRCPLAMEFHEKCKGDFAIGKQFIIRRSGDKIEKVKTPDNLSEFIAKFDVGAYPHLMAPPPRALPKPEPKRKHGRSGPSGPRSRKEAAKRVVRHHIAKMIGGR